MNEKQLEQTEKMRKILEENGLMEAYGYFIKLKGGCKNGE